MSEPCIVRVEPLGVEVEVVEGQTVMWAARQQGYKWPTACAGKGICTLCHVTISEGQDHAVAPEAWEIEKLKSVGLHPPTQRLACQLRVDGRVTVVKRGVRELPPR